MPFTREDRLLLARLTSPERGAESSTEDEPLLHLLARAQSGDTRAGEAVLASMAFSLAAMARRSLQTPLDQFVSAAWFVIAGFNLSRRDKVLTNLVLDTLKQVTRDRVSRWDERTVPLPETPTWPTAVDSRGRPERGEALAVLRTARDLDLIDERTRDALDAVYVQGLSGKEAAARLRDSPHMVRYRCSRGLRRLRAHQDQLVDASS